MNNIGRIPIDPEHEEVEINESGGHPIPDGAIGCVVLATGGGGSNRAYLDHLASGMTFEVVNDRGGSSGHHYETRNSYDIFFPASRHELIPNNVILWSNNLPATRITIIRWIYNHD